MLVVQVSVTDREELPAVLVAEPMRYGEVVAPGRDQALARKVVAKSVVRPFWLPEFFASCLQGFQALGDAKEFFARSRIGLCVAVNV